MKDRQLTHFWFLNKLRIPLGGYVLQSERCDKISGVYPSCGLCMDSHLSGPSWDVLLGTLLSPGQRPLLR